MDNPQEPDCQLGRIDNIHEPLGVLERVWQLRNRVRRAAKRRFAFALNFTRRLIQRQSVPAATSAKRQLEPLLPGDWVRVRSEGEIRETLGDWNDLQGCAFLEEMWGYCGTIQQVLKRVHRFLHERDYQVKRVRRVVLLDGLNCQGTVDFGPCDRNCFFFWREEWLEKLDTKEISDGGHT